MANAYSKPREFSNYIGSVNVDEYAKQLVTKQAEYQQGVQKVDQYYSSVANLPVANEADRKYVQGAADQIESSIKSSKSSDWSDQNLQNTIGTMAQTLSSDPKIRQAVASANHWKNQFSDAQIDDKRSKGANTLNKRALMDEYNSWSNTDQAGTAPDGEGYFNYVDANKIIADAYKEKHPNTTMSLEYAGEMKDAHGNIIIDETTGLPKINTRLAVKTWDETLKIWKGVSPLDVETEVKSIIKTDPNLQKQLQINGKYDNLEDPVSVLYTQAKLYSTGIEQLDSALGTMAKDDPQYDKLIKDRQFLKEQLEIAIPNKVREYRSDPSSIERDKEDLYQQDWINSQIGKYAYGEADMKHFGMGPSEKQFKERELELQQAHLSIAQQELKIHQQQLRDAESKERKERADFTTQSGIVTDKKDVITHFTETLDNARKEVEAKKNTYLYNNYYQTNKDWFTEDGMPTPEGRVKLADEYRKREEAFNNGNNKDNKGNWVDLTPDDLKYFKNIHSIDKVSKAMQNTLAETEQAWQKHRKDTWTPVQQQLYDNYQIDEKRHKDVHTKVDQITQEIVANNAQDNPGIKDQIAQKYGYGTYQIALQDEKQAADNAAIYGDIVPQLVRGKDQETNFKNNYLKSNDYVVNPQSTLWVNPKTGEADKYIAQRAIKLIPSGQRSKLLENNPDGKGIQISYVQGAASDNMKLEITDANNKKDPEIFEIAPEDVPIEWNDYRQESELSQLLRANRNKNSNISWTYGSDELGNPNQHNFANAEPLTTKEYNGKTISIKYGVKKEGNNFTLELWAKDVNDPNDKGHLIRNPKTNIVLTASNPSLSVIEQKINNYAETGSLDNE